MTQPTSQGFGADPCRSCANVVVVKENVWSPQVRLVVTSALCVSPGELGVWLVSEYVPFELETCPHQVLHWPVAASAAGTPARLNSAAATRAVKCGRFDMGGDARLDSRPQDPA